MLKKCLLGLFVLLVGFIGFSNAGQVTYNFSIVPSGISYPTNSWIMTIPFPDLNNSCIDFDYSCTVTRMTRLKTFKLKLKYETTASISVLGTVADINSGISAGMVFSGSVNSSSFANCKTYYQMYLENTDAGYAPNFDITCTLSGDNIGGNCPSCPECETCPEINTGDILSGSCDINYCVENNLCPTSSGSRSELKINDIVHEGKPLINVSIPDNIYWDYSTDENQFDLYVGSGYDQDYIDSILKINSYRPDNEDFTNIFVSGLTLIFPYIFVALLIVFIWKLLKRIFK